MPCPTFCHALYYATIVLYHATMLLGYYATMLLGVYTYMYIYIYIHTHIHIHIYIYIYICICILVSVYLSIYLSIDPLPRRPNHALTHLSFPVSNPLRHLFRHLFPMKNLSCDFLGCSWWCFRRLLGRSWVFLGTSWVDPKTIET